MLKFKTVTLCDKPWVDKIVMAENSRSADFNFGNIYIWDDHYHQLICRFGERMITKLRYNGERAFAFPIGSGELRSVIEELRSFTAERGYPLCIRGLTDSHREMLEREYPDCFTYTEDESCADYIYDIERLSTYAGKALHGKKNHCNRFEAEREWSFVPLTRELIPRCMDMLSIWTEDNSERLDDSISYEHEAIVRAFAAYEKLGLEGGVLLSGEEILGFTIGEMISEDCFDVHFEKAIGTINGAYPMVCREFARMLRERHPTLRYINREDDMGIEALRRSKRSYKPEYLLRKYTARWIY